MKFTQQKEIEGVRKALKVFLAQQGTNFKTVCLENELDYNKEYQKVFRGWIDESDINRIAGLIDPSVKLKKINDTFVLNRSLTPQKLG